MVKSNEFTDLTLRGAIKKATSIYRRKPAMETKDRCSDLAFDLADFKREASDALDEMQDLQRDIDRLRDEARRAALEAVINAAIAASGELGAAIRALRLLSRLKKLDLSHKEWLGLVPVLGGSALSVFKALEAVGKFREAERLSHQAERVWRRAERLGDEILRIAEEYRGSGCAASDRIS